MSHVKLTVLRFFFIFCSYTLNRRLKILCLAVFIISKKTNNLDCDFGAHKSSKKKLDAWLFDFYQISRDPRQING